MGAAPARLFERWRYARSVDPLEARSEIGVQNADAGRYPGATAAGPNAERATVASCAAWASSVLILSERRRSNSSHRPNASSAILVTTTGDQLPPRLVACLGVWSRPSLGLRLNYEAILAVRSTRRRRNGCPPTSTSGGPDDGVRRSSIRFRGSRSRRGVRAWSSFRRTATARLGGGQRATLGPVGRA